MSVKRVQLIMIFIALMSLMLLARVYFLSIKTNTYYEALSKQNYIKRVYEVQSRGIIEDRNGVALAINNLGFSITVKPHLRSRKNRKILEEVCDTIVNHFKEFDRDKLIKKYNKLDSAYKHNYVKLIDYIPYDKFFSKYTIFNSVDNIKIVSAVKRHYPFKKVASHIVGYVGKASRKDIDSNHLSKYSGIIGKNGLEKFYNKKLQGKLGFKDVKVNALYQEIELLHKEESTSKNNIATTVDIRLQKYIHSLFKNKSGSIVVMNAKNGEILAAGSFPEFDNNIFVDGISHKEWDILKNNLNHPFTNKIINGLYPPGSVWKMGVALSLLENKIHKDFTATCDGTLPLGNRNFRCWKEKGHGRVNFRKAIRESCDIFFYKASLKVGIKNIKQTMDKFGFGQKTGIDQVNEFIGINPNPKWKYNRYKQSWTRGETVISAIGQGYVLVTPIQIARYTSFLATSKLPTPHFFKENYTEPKKIDVDEKHLKIIRSGMYDVVHHKKGTAHAFTLSSKVSIYAKTGTAQVVSIPQSEKKRMLESELAYFKRSHAWLSAFGPYKDPTYVVSVVVEHGGHGGSAAGLMVSNIFNKLLELGYIKQ